MIRKLTVEDFDSFLFIRREALRQAPDAFLTTLEQFDARTREFQLNRFNDNVTSAKHFIVGAFQGDGQIAGMAGFRCQDEPNYDHTGMVWGVFVRNEARGAGFGKGLMNALIEYAAAMPNMEQARLSVYRHNESAISVYKNLGFLTFNPEQDDPFAQGACSTEIHMRIDLKNGG